ncbi:SH3 domain-binding glutamic acid-rich-like protein 2-like [Arapaima gigas]
MVVRVFIASSSGSVVIKKRQQAIVGFLEANRIPFEEVDITMREEQRFWMYQHIPEDKHPEKGNPLPPQIFNDQQYCGDYEDFFQAKENNTVFLFLRLPTHPSVQDSNASSSRFLPLFAKLHCVRHRTEDWTSRTGLRVEQHRRSSGTGAQMLEKAAGKEGEGGDGAPVWWQ